MLRGCGNRGHNQVQTQHGTAPRRDTKAHELCSVLLLHLVTILALETSTERAKPEPRTEADEGRPQRPQSVQPGAVVGEGEQLRRAGSSVPVVKVARELPHVEEGGQLVRGLLVLLRELCACRGWAHVAPLGPVRARARVQSAGLAA